MKKNNTKGFTLIEVLIAMSVITIVLMAFFGVLNNIIKMNKKTEKDIQMMDVAQSKIESTVGDIRESTKNKTDIVISIDTGINDEEINLDDFFKRSNMYYKEFDYIYKDNKSKYSVEFQVERTNLDRNTILEDRCFLYNISYTVKEKEKIFSNREVTLTTSVLSLK